MDESPLLVFGFSIDIKLSAKELEFNINLFDSLGGWKCDQ